MGFDQRGTVVLTVTPGAQGKWDVCEKGFEKPLASFDSKEDAYAYANDMKKGKEGQTVLAEEGKGASTPPQQGQAT